MNTFSLFFIFLRGHHFGDRRTVINAGSCCYQLSQNQRTQIHKKYIKAFFSSYEQLCDKQIWMLYNLKWCWKGIFICITDAFQSLKYRSVAPFFHLLILLMLLPNKYSLLFSVCYTINCRFSHIDVFALAKEVPNQQKGVQAQSVTPGVLPLVVLHVCQRDSRRCSFQCAQIICYICILIQRCS